MKPYHIHGFHADPFARVVILVVGDYKACSAPRQS